jgi:hypothetical protein
MNIGPFPEWVCIRTVGVRATLIYWASANPTWAGCIKDDGTTNKFHGVDDLYFDRVKIEITIRMLWKGFALGGVWIILAFSRGSCGLLA